MEIARVIFKSTLTQGLSKNHHLRITHSWIFSCSNFLKFFWVVGLSIKSEGMKNSVSVDINRYKCMLRE